MIGVSSYSFGSYFEKLGAKGIMAKAKEIGFEAFEFAEFGNDDKAVLMEKAKEYKDAAQEVGITVNMVAAGADMTNYCGGAKTLEEEIERIKGRVDFAEALGVTKMRHDIGWNYNGGSSLKNFFEGLPVFAKACLEITKYAEQKGIKTMFENHGFFVQGADRVMTLLEEVNHPNFGLLLDMGNFLCADDNHFNSVKVLAKYAFHCHAKDFFAKPYNSTDVNEEEYFRTTGGTFLAGSGLGEGIVNPKRCMEILKDMGYNGDISLEYEGSEDNLSGIAKGFKVLKENW